MHIYLIFLFYVVFALIFFVLLIYLDVQAEELESVVFTPQKKQKKRAATTLIASSLEDLKTQQTSAGEKMNLLTSLTKAATTGAAVPSTATSVVPVASTVSSTEPSKASAVAPPAAVSAVPTALTAQTGVKRKASSATTPASDTKKRIKPTTITAAAPAPAAIAAASAVKPPVPAVTTKITAFLLSPSKAAAVKPAEDAAPTTATATSTTATTGTTGSSSSSRIAPIEIDLE